MNTRNASGECVVPFERLAKFVRQLTHEVRNGLSAVDLEGAFIAELATDPEIAEEVRKLRGMVTNTARMLRDISRNFQPMTIYPTPWPVATLMEELRERFQTQFSEEAQAEMVQMEFQLHGESVDVDLEELIGAVFQVFKNAFQFGENGTKLKFSVFVEGDQVVMEVREPKKSFESQVPPEEWGNTPLVTTRSGGYGLGLFHVRQVLEAHEGTFITRFSDQALITRMSVPVLRDSGE